MQPAQASTKTLGNFSSVNSANGSNGDFTLGGNLIANGQSITFPPNAGSANYFLQTNGAGVTSWAQDSLAHLSDVTLAGIASGNYLRYSGTTWANVVPSPADVGLANLSSVTTTTVVGGTQLRLDCGDIKFNAASDSNTISLSNNQQFALKVKDPTANVNYMILDTTNGTPSTYFGVPIWNGAGVTYNGTNFGPVTNTTLDNTATLWEFDGTSATVVTLPLISATNGCTRYVIAKTGVGSTVTIQTQGSDKINGTLTSLTLTNQWDHAELISNANGVWYAL